MSTGEVTSAVNLRYSELAETSCCLSCGGAINHGDPKPGETAVDLGSGRGNDVIRLAESVGPTGRAIGIDVSDGMIAKARRQAERLGVDNAEYRQAELTALPLEDNSVDLIISNCTLNHATDKPAVWNEIRRVLCPGGRFVVSDIYSSAPVPEAYANDPDAVAECWAGSVTRAEYLEHLGSAGFHDITVLEESDPYQKGAIEVVSWTILGAKPGGCCCSE